MSVDAFKDYLSNLKHQVSRDDRTWFMRWIQRYADFCQCSQQQLDISKAEVIKFSIKQIKGVRSAPDTFILF